MKLPRFRMLVLVAAIVGVALPLVFLLLTRLTHDAPVVDRAMVFLWPTCPFLMATEGHEYTFSGYAVLAAIIASNALLYIFGFAFVWCLAWVIRAWRRSLHDGTTI